MIPARKLALVALIAGAAISATGCGADETSDTREGADAPSRAASPPPVKIVRRQAEPTVTPAPSLSKPPSRGEVELVEGTFTDRLEVLDLQFEAGRRPTVSGGLLNRTDVSELLALTVQADFYDAAGQLVSSGEQSFDHGEAFHEEALRFEVKADESAPRAVAARLSIPQLVNE